MQAKTEALKERGRRLLLKAAYLDIAMSQETFSLFTEQAVINLKRYKYPLARRMEEIKRRAAALVKELK